MYKKHVCVTGVCYFVIYHQRYAMIAIYKSMNIYIYIYSLQRPKTDTLETKPNPRNTRNIKEKQRNIMGIVVEAHNVRVIGLGKQKILK